MALSQAPLYWYNNLKHALQQNDVGFRTSDLTFCVFFGDGMIVLVYVDDCLIFGPDQAIFDAKNEAFIALDWM